MSKLAEFRRAERELQQQLVLLEQLQADTGLQREMEFEEKLTALMGEYGMELTKVVIFRRRLHQLIGRNGCCAASS